MRDILEPQSPEAISNLIADAYATARMGNGNLKIGNFRPLNQLLIRKECEHFTQAHADALIGILSLEHNFQPDFENRANFSDQGKLYEVVLATYARLIIGKPDYA